MSECEYCDARYGGMGEDLICQDLDLGMLGKGRFRADIMYTENEGYTLDASIYFDASCIGHDFKIKYCPMCGRKLCGEEEHPE